VVRIEVPAAVARYIVEKGSITVDGISLTVSGLGAEPRDWFEVSLIPTTRELTTLGSAPVGTLVNLEVDVIAKYVSGYSLGILHLPAVSPTRLKMTASMRRRLSASAGLELEREATPDKRRAGGCVPARHSSLRELGRRRSVPAG